MVFYLTKRKYVDDLLLKLQLSNLKPTPPPSVLGGHKLSLYTRNPLENSLMYRSVIGALQYLNSHAPEHCLYS